MDLGQLAAVDAGLLQACLEGNFAAVRHAVDHGAVVTRARDPMGWTPLHMAALGGHVAVGEWCLDRGLSPWACADAQGVLPLHAAAFNGRVAFLKWLVAKESRATRVEKVSGCLDAQGGTPLHHASLGGQAAAVRWLLYHGADERAPTVDGLTAERLACEAGEEAIVKILRSCAAHRKHLDPDRPTDLPPPFAAATTNLQSPAIMPSSYPTTDDDHGLDAGEKAALAEAEREAEQFRQEEMERLLAEEDARRRAEGNAAAARLIARERAKRDAAASKSAHDDAKKAAQGEDWMRRYQEECARRETDRLRAQGNDDTTTTGER